MRNLAPTLTIALVLYAFLLGWAMHGYYQPPLMSGGSINEAPDSIIAKQKGSIEVSRKFRPNKSFIDYPTSERYTGKPMRLDYSNYKSGIGHEALLKKAVAAGANFAGHFVFTEIRTDKFDLTSIIVDLRSGRVYEGPATTTGYQFYLGSSMLMVNPPIHTVGILLVIIAIPYNISGWEMNSKSCNS